MIDTPEITQTAARQPPSSASPWIAENGHQPAPDFWESYLAGPDSGPDPANWRTELNRPLID